MFDIIGRGGWYSLVRGETVVDIKATPDLAFHY